MSLEVPTGPLAGEGGDTWKGALPVGPVFRPNKFLKN